ncbi:MAG: CNNM domain-containing protein [Thermoguttaceae bacterium]
MAHFYIFSFVSIGFLMCCSAFFSSSEAAYFSMSKADRKSLPEMGRLGKMAEHLASQSQQLLNSILLGNLIVNLLTFTLSSTVAFRLQKEGRSDLATLTIFATLFCVLLFCELIPKNLGVRAPQLLSRLFALPLTLIVQLLRPALPILERVNVLSRRLFWPKFQPESDLRVGDLERAVEMSHQDTALLKREQRVLHNIVRLSELCAEELMRPRALIRLFQLPITFEQVMESLRGRLPRSGFCLLTEPNSDEIVAAVPLTRLSAKSMQNWENQFRQIIYVPWSASVAEVFDQLQRENRDVAVVLNEFGGTIGILTRDDIVETIFTREQGRSHRLTDRIELKRLGVNLWQVNGLTSLRRLQKKFATSFDDFSCVTVGGIIREKLERFPRVGDTCDVGSLHFEVVEVSQFADFIANLSVNLK